ncbi:MAG: FIST C-terminal domain-containing protein [Chloroflexi bacterium]|nr:FIST C-terminal domain-containing protein [Chloroflexota bacterium]MBV9599964.1 FIST C-terminal domain-containing protein [Chloroflexota bacterium]
MTMRAGGGLGIGSDWRSALETALDGALAPLDGDAPNLLLVFASAGYEADYPELIRTAVATSRTTELAGCGASAVIAEEREVETEAGIAALALTLPLGGILNVRYVAADEVRGDDLAGMSSAQCHGLVVLADPFTADIATLIETLEREYSGAPIVGGLATGNPAARSTCVFHGATVVEEGAVVIGVGGTLRLRPLVSQGCEPIGEPWTVTDADQHIVRSIGGRPAYQVLLETVNKLDPETRDRLNTNLRVGLAMNEYRDEFKRGDFLIRNLVGVDPRSGAIAVAGEPRVGQTLQFQILDARAADQELRHMLLPVADASSVAALLFACNGRGKGLFGTPDHDARTVREVLGPLPLAGLFCNGEIGPVGGATFLHGYTASLGLIEEA